MISLSESITVPGQKNGIGAFRGISLGIVCPMANESATAVQFVDAVLHECNQFGFQSVTFYSVLDNVSKDDTLQLMNELAGRQPQLKIIWAPENRCVRDAFVRGYEAALAGGCDWILEIDAGFSHQPEEIPRFFRKMAEGYACVFGSRFCEGGSMDDSPLTRRVISRGGTAITNLLLGTRLKDMTSGFELFSRAALQAVLAKGVRSRGPFFQTEIKSHCRDLPIAEVPITYRAPSHKVNSAALKDAFANLWRLFRRRLANQ